MCWESDQLMESLSKLGKELESRMIIPTQPNKPELGVTNINVSNYDILIIDYINLIES